jgi:hypothetical protein
MNKLNITAILSPRGWECARAAKDRVKEQTDQECTSVNKPPDPSAPTRSANAPGHRIAGDFILGPLSYTGLSSEVWKSEEKTQFYRIPEPPRGGRCEGGEGSSKGKG